MLPRNLTSESVLIGVVFLAGLALRLAASERLAVEHFDEGIYTSVLWYDQLTGSAYPARHLYAPPLLGALITVVDWIPGLHGIAPFLPGIVLGAMTVVVIGWLARSWFGRVAGAFAAVIVCCSDFHILCSRTALTDVPVLFLTCLAVGWGTSGLQFSSIRRMMLGGIFCGLAWWTKYSGWLPLAIVGGGGVMWWVWRGRRQLGMARLLLLLGTMAAVSVIVWLPWLWALQDVGGYSAVAANHRGYLGGWGLWKDRLTQQLASQFWLDGLSGSLSVGLGILLAGGYRWVQLRCSTWNRHASEVPAVVSTASSATASVASSASADPPFRVLLRFAAAAVALSIIASAVWTPLLLTCIALGGICGIVLWPVLQRMYARNRTRDFSPTGSGGIPLTRADLASAARIDPTLGVCMVTVWFAGMLATTPLYYPYPRLFLPLLASIWIASAGAVGWWIEANLSVARRPAADSRTGYTQTLAGQLVMLMILVAISVSILAAENVPVGSVYVDRTTLRDAAIEAAVLCVSDVRQQQRPVAPIKSADDSAHDGTAAIDPVPITVDNFRRTRMIVYAYGEPALLYHLNELGVVARPVRHLNLSSPAGTAGAPAYLVFGPYAKRTPEFWDEWLTRKLEDQFLHIGDVKFRPSPIVLLDLFSPAWLRSHEDAVEQRLEVYRIR